MKYLFNVILSCLITTFVFSQSKSALSDYFYSVDNHFKWNSFSFKSDWDSYSSQFTKNNEMNDSYNFLQNYKIDDDYIKQLYECKYLPIFENIKFDKSYLQLENNKVLYYDKLVFLKSFEKITDASIFYTTTKKILTNKFGIGDSTYHYEYQNEAGRVWWGNNIAITLKKINGKFIYLTVKNVKSDYHNSIQFKKDYNNLTFDFKEIDDDYSFKGIKFETQLNIIKKSYNFQKYLNRNFSYMTFDKYFLTWKSFQFSEYVLFNFNKEMKFAEVHLFYDYNTLSDFNYFHNRLVQILGQPSKEDEDSKMWIGKNILIGTPKNYSESSRRFSLSIISNNIEMATEKDY